MINKTFPIAEKLLASGLQSSQNLLLQLQEEAEILKNSKQPAPALDSITRQKQQFINELNLFSKQVGQVLATERLSNDRNGINAYFEKAGNAGLDVALAATTWRKILDIATQSQTLNEQNGASIDLLLRHTRQSLNILKGKPQTAHTYGRDGSTKSELFSSTLISV